MTIASPGYSKAFPDAGILCGSSRSREDARAFNSRGETLNVPTAYVAYGGAYSAYTAAGSIIVLLLGAQFTKAWSDHRAPTAGRRGLN